ncbi:hypothetical protein FZEAL_10614 [Fusarium zealandicum]|uniref:Cas1p 10 TM acyl transferase domain-containing protein n=1 Tax=Fusarium zealandicum TaxID=1053134 RepID=A0A8H4TZD3_9HYPO|nr:hypothetical protein FZEAL_10614 [Fusarium zealandicum]
MFQSSPRLALAARVLPIAFSILLVIAVILDGISPNDDPYRCKALLGDDVRNGSWLHAPDSNGDRKPFTNWQPDGCMLHKYSREDIHQCMGDRHMVFSGDSTTRQVFWAMARLLDRDKADQVRSNAKKHESYDMTFDGVRIKQIWNPWFETGELNPNLTRELELFTKEKHSPVSIEEQKGAALMMLGAGSWYVLKHVEEESKKLFQSAFDNVTELLHLDDLPTFGSLPMDPEDGVGNEVFIAPVTAPFYKELPESRTGPEGIHKGEVEAIDQYIYDTEKDRNLRLLRVFPELSHNQPEAIVDRHNTGFHVIDSVAEVKAQILLNLRCNAKLDQSVGYPYDRTCCTDYGSRPFAQVIVLGLTALYALACVVFELIDITTSAKSPRSQLFNMKVGVFAVALLYCYVADRTTLFSKGMKEFVPLEFMILIVLCSIVGVATIRRSTFRAPRIPVADTTPVTPVKEDAGILSRDQTEEWKGWMQAAILVYHWTGASRNLPIYMFIRLMVAAYLFQTGYGHAVYFLAKKDFSFRRIANVLLRLNVLSCALPYVMGNDYMFYYFAPLVSFWFLVVYATMAICPKYNDNTNAVICKIFASLILVTGILRLTPLTGWAFAILDALCRIKWDLHEWEFRVGLDGFIVYAGMLAGVAHQRVTRNSSLLTNYKSAIIPSIVILVAYAAYAIMFCDEKPKYTSVHPYFSFLPVLAFIALRNATTPLRNCYSTAAAWLGRCSLETFILQYHIYLAADTKGILLLDSFKGDGSLLGDRWRDLVVIVPIFLWISHLVAEASGSIVKLVMHKPEEPEYDEENAVKINYTLLDGYALDQASRVLRAITSVANDPRLRIAAILGIMWLLNWMD